MPNSSLFRRDKFDIIRASLGQNLVFKALFGSASDYKYFLLPHANKKRPLPVLLDSGLRLYGFVDIDSAFESELDIVFSFDFYAID